MAQPVTKHHRPKTQFFSTLLVVYADELAALTVRYKHHDKGLLPNC